MKPTCQTNLISLLAVFAIGCSTYGWADGPLKGGDAVALHVQTIDAPAHLGIDQVTLRTLLIDELEMHGVYVVETGADESLRCTLMDHQSRGFDRQMVAELDLSCHIRPVGAQAPGQHLQVTGMAATGFGAESSVPSAATMGARRADESAVVDAITRLAPQVAAAIDRPSSQ